MNCTRIQDDEIAERYVTGQLSDADREAYELHYFACESCFAELEALCAIQLELAADDRAAAPQPSPVRRWRLPVLVPAAAAAAVVLAVGLWYGRSAAPVRQAERPADAAPADSRRDQLLLELARLDAPPYSPVRLRSSPSEARRRFSQAMEHYQRGDYQSALGSLETAARLDPRAADILFYLGVCNLLAGRTGAAIDILHNTVALGDSPFVEEAHFYLAKAYLRQKAVHPARAELTEVVALHGDFEREAAELLAKLEAF